MSCSIHNNCYISTHTHTHTHTDICSILLRSQQLRTCPHAHTHTTCTDTLVEKNYTCTGLIMMVKTHAFRCKVCPFKCVRCRCIPLNLDWRVQEATDSILIFYTYWEWLLYSCVFLCIIAFQSMHSTQVKRGGSMKLLLNIIVLFISADCGTSNPKPLMAIPLCLYLSQRTVLGDMMYIQRTSPMGHYST